MKEVRPPEAFEIIENNNLAVLIDVRTSMEYEYVGHPVGAINIPWVEAPDWQRDIEFVSKVREVLQRKHPDKPIETVPILAICRSGKRSEAASMALIDAGFSEVTNVIEGFEGDRDGEKHRSKINGWRFHNLPWEQS